MSRNLCSRVCYHCGTKVVLVEAVREIAQADAGAYFKEFAGMLVANAECPVCRAKYLAWIDGSQRKTAWKGSGWGYPTLETDEAGLPQAGDLSYRSTFNDEPGPSDLPDVEVMAALERARRAGWRDKLDVLIEQARLEDAW